MHRLTSFLLLGWIVVFLIMKYALQFIPGISANSLLSVLHGSATSLGLVAAVFFYAYLLFQVPAGLIIDYFPLVPTLLITILFCLLGGLLFFSANLALLVTGRVLMGIGASFATVSYMRCAALYFKPNWFARLAGFFGTACMGGAGLSMLFFGWIYQAFNFHVMMVVINSILITMIVIGGGLMLLTLHHYTPPIRQTTARKRPSSIQLRNNLKKIFVQRNTWLLLIYNGAAFSPISVFGGLWGTNYLHTIYHLSENSAHVAISIMFYSFAVGGPILCWYANTFKKQKTIMISGVIVALIAFTVLIFANARIPGQYVWGLMAIIGFFSSSFLASYAMASLLYTPALIATVIAIINMGDPIFGGLAEPLIGKILDGLHFSGSVNQSFHAYTMSMLVLMIYWFIACFSALFIARTQDS